MIVTNVQKKDNFKKRVLYWFQGKLHGKLFYFIILLESDIFRGKISMTKKLEIEYPTSIPDVL